MPERRVFVSGYYGYSNPGDEAILSVLVSELRRCFPDVRVTVVSGTPGQTAEAHSVEAVLWSDPLAIARAVRDADLVITGGGGIFHDYGGFPSNGLLIEGNWGIGFHVTAGLLAAVFGKPLMLYALGVGPLFSEDAKTFTRAICHAAQVITVRDPASAELLVSIGVPRERVEVTADPAFLLEPAGASFHDKPVTVCVRHWSHGADPALWEPALGDALRLFLDADPSRQVRLLPFQRFPGEQEDDLAVARRVCAFTRHDRCQIADGFHAPAEIASLIASSRLVLGMRLHSLIFAWNARVPFVALRYDDKVAELVRRSGREHLSLAVSDIEPARLRELLELAVSSSVPDPEPLRTLARHNAELAASLLADPPDVPALQGEPLALLHRGLFSLLESNAELRRWLADQKTNYEFEIRQLRSEGGNHVARAMAAEARLAESEKKVAEWQQHSKQLEEAAAAKRAYYEARLSEWNRYAGDLAQRLTVYRSQRAWKGMLALRKAYTLLFRQGWSGRARFLPWLLQLAMGQGKIETEQLQFPPRPK